MLEVEGMKVRLSRRHAALVAGIAFGLAAIGSVSATAFNDTDQVSATTSPKEYQDAPIVQFDDEFGASADLRLALVAASGARVFVGQAKTPGDYCLVYEDGNGTSMGTCGPNGGTPAGRGLVLKTLDTVSNRYVIVVVVPDGFDTASIGGRKVLISNNVFVVDEDLATNALDISGPAGQSTLNLAEFVE